MADVTCARCKKSAPPGARFGLCVECTMEVRKAEAKRQAAYKKRKVEQTKQSKRSVEESKRYAGEASNTTRCDASC